LILFDRYTIDNNRHKTVINTTKLATLAKEAAPTIDEKADLIDTARASIHFYTKSRDGSTVQHIGSGNKNTDVGTNG